MTFFRKILFACLFLAAGAPMMAQVTSAKYEGYIVDNISISADGPITGVTLEDLQKLIVVKQGDKYEAIKIKQCIQRLSNAHLFFDVQPDVSVTSPGHVSIDFKITRTVIVSRISFTGDKKLDPTLLLREVMFRETEAFDREAFDATLARLGVFYDRNGYFRKEIKPELTYDRKRSLVRVDFEIHAGHRARVDSLALDTVPPANPAGIQKEMKTRQAKKYSGVVLDEDVQNLTRQYSLLGYLNVDLFARNVDYHPETNSVGVALRINPKDFVNVDIRGIKLNPDKKWELMPLYTERSIEPVFVEESGQNIARYLQQKGYFFATVRPALRSDPPRAVILEVETGKKYSLADIKFENIDPVDENDLKAVLALRTQTLFSRGVYGTDLLNDDAERVRNVFVREGYTDAQVTAHVEPHDGDADVIFKVVPGPVFHVNSIEIVGNRVFTDDSLMGMIRSKVGGVYSPYTVALDRSVLITAYENSGFSNIDFRSDIHHPFPGLADITYYITEGDSYFIENVILTGNLITRENIIRRELTFHVGEPISLEKLLTSESNLYNLGVFNRVVIEPEPTFRDPLQKILAVHLEEAERHTLSYGVGYEDGDARATVGLSDNNFLGMARSLGTALRLGTRQQRGQISYTIPRPFDRRLPTIISLFGQHERKKKGDLQQDVGKPFDTRRFSALLQSERRLNAQTSLFFRYNYEKASVSNLENIELLFRENRPVRLSKLSASLLNDRRDDPLNATRGTFSSIDLQLIPRFLGSQSQFYRIFLQQQYFRPITKSTVFATSARFGWLKPFGKNTVDKTLAPELQTPIPISERFFAGGSTSLRGFRLDQAGPLFPKPVPGSDKPLRIPIGGNALFISNNELRFPIIGFIHGALFYDTGNVFRDLRDMSFGKFSNAVGFGFRLNTPVGPVRADFGYNLNPPSGIKKELLRFFTIGQTF
jgi:outer membrane protein assembly complex protein YaeT